MGRRKGDKDDGWTSHRRRKREIAEPGPGGKTRITEHLVPVHPVQQEEANIIPQVAELTPPHCTENGNNEPQRQNPGHNRSHQSRKESESTGWVEALPKLKEAYLQSMAPLHRTCQYCPFIMKPEGCPEKTDNILLCQDCGPAAYFCNQCFHTIHQISPLHVPVIWVVNMYRAIATDSTAYHRRFTYDIKYLQGIVPAFPDGSSCPVCVETATILPRVISMDGNFRLVRKKSAGTSVQKPHHQGRFILESEEVEPFLKAPTCAHDVECSDFKAGTPTRAAFKAAKLDVTGVFGSICVHDYPQLFINMNSGEKLGYAVCIIQKLVQENKDVKVLYDVACRLLPQLMAAKVNISEHDLAVGVFHGYAHNAKCQMEYNPRNKLDFRLADGENTERLWSELTHFVYITKEMTPSNRHDLLVDALLHWAEKAVNLLGVKIRKRLRNASELKAKSQVELDKLLQPLQDQGMDVSNDAIENWNVQLRNEYSRIRKKRVSSWQMTYAVLLKKWYSLRWRVAGVAVDANEVEAQAELASLQEKLEKTEKAKRQERWTQESDQFKKYLKEASDATRAEIIAKMHQEAVDRAQFIVMKKRARGYEEISKFSTQIQKTNLKLKNLLGHHNATHGTTERSFEDVKDPDAALYVALPTIGNQIPFPLLRDAIRLKNTIDRVEEEVLSLNIELPAALHGYEKQNMLLQQALNRIEDSAVMHQGLRAVIIKKILENENCIKALACEAEISFQLKVAIETPFSDSIPTQYLPTHTTVEDEQDVEEPPEEYDYHQSDDEVPTDDEL